MTTKKNAPTGDGPDRGAEDTAMPGDSPSVAPPPATTFHPRLRLRMLKLAQQQYEERERARKAGMSFRELCAMARAQGEALERQLAEWRKEDGDAE